MKPRIGKYGILALCISTLYSNANADDMAELKAQMKAMQQQMQLMQQKLDAQQKKLDQQTLTHKEADKKTNAKSEVSESDFGSKGSAVKVIAHEIADTMTISGEVVINTARTDSDAWSGESTSDVILDTLALGIDAQINPWVNTYMGLLYEQEDDDNLKVDEATITIGNSDISPVYLSAGRMFVPFGSFESNMISDPITLTLAETREEAFQLGVELENGLFGSVYLFNGKIVEANSTYSSTSNSQIDNFGLNVGYALSNDQMDLDLGLGYMNNIATTDGLQDFVDENGLCSGDGCIKDYVGGLSLHAIASFADFIIIGEYITALDKFEHGELGADELQPKTWNIEAAYSFNLMGKDANIAVGYQGSDDFYLDDGSTDHFEKAWFVGMNVDVYKNTTLSFEWRHAKAYSEVKDALKAAGDKYDNENLLQMNLSVAF